MVSRKISVLGHRDSLPDARSPPTAGFLATSQGKSPETGLAGWGARIRTAKWRFKKRPLTLRQNFGDLARLGTQRFLRGSTAETRKDTSAPFSVRSAKNTQLNQSMLQRAVDF